MGVLIVFTAFLTAVVALQSTERIIGGQPTTVAAYPEIASLSRSYLWMYLHACGGTILTTRVVLTAAHCVYGDTPQQWRARVGSTYSNDGGAVYNIASITAHPEFNMATIDNDIALLRTDIPIVYGNLVKAASIPSANYELADNKSVVAVGWGAVMNGGPSVSRLRHVQTWTVNQEVCAARYQGLGQMVTENMVCAGWLDVGGRDACQGDSGGPMFDGRVVVGVISWGQQCALPQYPGVSTRVSKYTAWIQANV